MDEITLNGFEVFEDFLPGANVPKKETQPAGNDDNNEDILDGVGESMTDEELEALRNPKKEKDTKDDKQEEEVEEPVKEPKKKVRKRIRNQNLKKRSKKKQLKNLLMNQIVMQ